LIGTVYIPLHHAHRTTFASQEAMAFVFAPSHLRIFPITHQSGDIPLSEWITLYTLCLAPLIAHILAGVPTPSYLCLQPQPKWHDLLCHYNPTSILWRYAAIADRRLRARQWDVADVGATNAVFWTEHGWDGSEEMVGKAKPFCSRAPEHTRIELFSREMLKTLIVMFQGIQAIFLLISVFTIGSESFTVWMAVDVVFFPVAFIGLQRLYSALWLSDDYLYTANLAEPRREGAHLIPSSTEIACREDLEDMETRDTVVSSRYRPTTFWVSRLFRCLYLVTVVGLWIMMLLFLLLGAPLTATTFLAIVFYLLFLAASTLIICYYFIQGRTTTTIIPCIHRAWYKIYTLAVIALGLTLVVIASIETRRTPCGKYTSGPGYDGDVTACLTATSDVLDLAPGKGYFGLSSTFWEGRPNETVVLGDGESWIYNFTGTCLGAADYAYAQIVRVERLESVRGPGGIGYNWTNCC